MHFSQNLGDLLSCIIFSNRHSTDFSDSTISIFFSFLCIKMFTTAEKIQVIDLWDGDTDIVSLRSTLLFGLKGMAAYAHHAMNLGYTDNEVLKWFYKGLCEVNREHSVTEWIELIMEFGQVNFKCMELLDKANTESFGNPVPTRVNVDIKKVESWLRLLDSEKEKSVDITKPAEKATTKKEVKEPAEKAS